MAVYAFRDDHSVAPLCSIRERMGMVSRNHPAFIPGISRVDIVGQDRKKYDPREVRWRTTAPTKYAFKILTGGM